MISIVGANGFIGRNLAIQLDNKVTHLFAKNFNAFPVQCASDGRVISDFTDLNSYWELLSQSKTVILLSNSGRGNTPQNDINAHKQFCDALEQRDNKIEHVIYASSGGAIYGDVSYAVSEDHVASPISDYGKAKLEIEKTLLNASNEAAWKTTIMRIANPIGLWARQPGFVENALLSIRDEKSMNLWAQTDYVRDYFAVTDLVIAIERIVHHSSPSNQIYNIGAGRGYTIQNILDLVCEVTGSPVKVKKSPPSNGDVKYNVLNCDRIKDDLGWEAQIDIKQTIQEIWDSI